MKFFGVVADLALSFLIPGLILLHLAVAPYTKVEESFNIQATHDILVYGTPTTDIHRKLASSYDHFTFPGAVPRTFVGSVLLAGAAQPVIALVGFHHAQFIVRAFLGLFNAACILVFARSIESAYGAATARWYKLFQASQFHVIFYASRTLPNMYAFGLTTLAFAFIVPSTNPKRTVPRQRLAISLFVFAAAVFRSEVAILLGSTILYLLFLPATSVELVIPPFVISFIVALLISIPIDSYFWQKPVWPELWGFYFNAIQGSSSEWGVSAWYYYYTSAIPRLLLNPVTTFFLMPRSMMHPALKTAGRRLLMPCYLFTAIYSLQPHKEARFIFYVVPPFTAACALSANLIFNRAFGKKKSSFRSKLPALVMIASIILTFVASTGMLLVSSLNYPGGEALSFLRDTVVQSEGFSSIASQSSTASTTPAVLVPAHADVLSCMTGVTLFGTATGSTFPNHRGSGGGNFLRSNLNSNTEGATAGTLSSGDAVVTIALDKTEDESILAQPEFWTRFDYALAEDPAKVRRGGEWDIIGVVKGYDGIEKILGGSEAREDEDTPEAVDAQVPVVGKGALVEKWKRRVMNLTGGRWVGPRMVPKIYILKRVKEGKNRTRKTVEA